MSMSMDQLRSAFKQPEQNNESRPNNYYPFWNMEVGEQAIVRFLPDKDPNNPLGFMVEKLMHNLEINGEKKSVPCLKMYNEDCPICKLSSSYYKADDEANGKKYWRKKQHIAQAIIVEDPLPADKDSGENHEGKVRFLALGYQLFNIIKDSFESGELDEVPFAFEGGCNFIIKKTEQGKYSTYAVGSKFARKVSDLTKDQIALAQDEMIELATLLPSQPSLEKVEGMLEAATTGGSYDDSASSSAAAADSSSESSTPAATPDKEDTTDYDEEADALLATIRSRRKEKV